MEPQVIEVLGLRFTMETVSKEPMTMDDDALFREVRQRWADGVAQAIQPWTGTGTADLRLVSDRPAE